MSQRQPKLTFATGTTASAVPAVPEMHKRIDPMDFKAVPSGDAKQTRIVD